MSSSSSFSAPLILIRFLGFVGILGSTFLLWSISMEPEKVKNSDPGQPAGQQKFWFAVLALPSDDDMEKVKKLMKDLRSEFGGPELEPHITVVGLTELTEKEAFERFHSAVDGMKAYCAKVDRVDTGASYYQCVFLLIEPSREVVDASVHCAAHFGYKSTTPYMPHMSLIYGDLSEEEKKRAEEKANKLEKNISKWEFNITRLVLQKVPDLTDKSTKSWQNLVEWKLINKTC